MSARRGNKIQKVENVNEALDTMFDVDGMSTKLNKNLSNNDGKVISMYYSSKREIESIVDSKSLSTEFSI